MAQRCTYFCQFPDQNLKRCVGELYAAPWKFAAELTAKRRGPVALSGAMLNSRRLHLITVTNMNMAVRRRCRLIKLTAWPGLIIIYVNRNPLLLPRQ